MEKAIEDPFIVRTWSCAGHYTCVLARHPVIRKLNLAFDMGICPTAAVEVEHVFLSHGHVDHCTAVISHARRRSLMNYNVAKYYMPRYMLSSMKIAVGAFEALHGSSIPMKLVGMDPDEEASVGYQCTVLAFKTNHSANSQGYIVYRKIKRGLKKEYMGLEGQQLKALKNAGVFISNFENCVEVAFTGDTVIEPLLSDPLVQEARVLVMESTYLDGEVNSTERLQYMHTHIRDIVKAAQNGLFRNEVIVLMHISLRYYPSCIRNILRKELPENLKRRVWVCVEDTYGDGKPVPLFLPHHPQPSVAASATHGDEH